MTSIAKEQSEIGHVFRLKLTNVLTNDPRVAKGAKYFDVEIVVDPDRDYLVRELEVRKAGKSDFRQKWTVTEFMKVRDESSNKDRWFPQAGRLDQVSSIGSFVTRISMKEARINPDLPLSLFRPDIPHGTSVVDVTSNGTRRKLP